MHWAAAVISCLMTCTSPANTQARPGLRVVVVQGQNAINNIGSGSFLPLEVQVRDENDKPVPEASVTFELPERGASGTFLGAYKRLNLTTDEQGNAGATNFQPNLVEGRFQIHVTAALGDRTGSVDINQTNTLRNKDLNLDDKGNGGIVAKLKSIKLSRRTKIIAAAAVAGIVVLAVTTGGGSSSTAATSSTATSIIPGTVAVGAPR
jgi:hypothetical protein